jgi:hypothetical protein
MKRLFYIIIALCYAPYAATEVSAWERGKHLYIKNTDAKSKGGGPLVIKVKMPENIALNQQTRHMNRCESVKYIEKIVDGYRLRYALIDNSSLANGRAPLSAKVVFTKFERAIKEIAKTDFQPEIATIPKPILQYCPHKSDDPSYFDWREWKKSGKQLYRINISDSPLRKKGVTRLTTLLIHEFSHAYDHMRGMETPKKRYGIEKIIVRGECVAYMKQLHALKQLGGFESEVKRVTGAILIKSQFKKELARNLKSYKHCDIFRDEMSKKYPDADLFHSFEQFGVLETQKILPKLIEWNDSFLPTARDKRG